MSDNKHKRGPKPETVKIEGDWENAIDKALKKERPEDGWPKPEPSQSVSKKDDSHSDPDSEPVEGD